VPLVSTFSRDITDRQRVERALRESEQRFPKAFQNSPLALTITSLTTGALVAVNDTFVGLTDYGREEAVGSTNLERSSTSDPRGALGRCARGHPPQGAATT
jgi:PAS domain-containing protein